MRTSRSMNDEQHASTQNRSTAVLASMQLHAYPPTLHATRGRSNTTINTLHPFHPPRLPMLSPLYKANTATPAATTNPTKLVAIAEDAAPV